MKKILFLVLVLLSISFYANTQSLEKTLVVHENPSLEKQDRKEVIAKWSESILFSYPASEEGMLMWKKYLNYIRESLWNLDFDTSDVSDEDYWNWYLAHLITYFYVCCDDLPNRECESYNNNLLRKNFLDYQNGRFNKTPCTWEDVRNALEDGEVAVELSVLPDEFLVLRKGCQKPISIPIDSIICERILNADVHKHSDIYQLYSSTGALHDLWMILDPYLEGASTIYFSAAHYYTQFNYSAIPINTDQTVMDKYRLRYVLSTADIRYLKESDEMFDPKNIVLLGGVEYDLDSVDIIAESRLYHDLKDDVEWSLTRGLPEDVRSGFHYLPGSLDEVNTLDGIMREKDLNVKLLTGKSASEEAFKYYSKDAELLHIATHGFMLAPLFNSEKGDSLKISMGNKYQTILSQSGLLLAGANHVWQGESRIEGTEDGILTSKEIANLDLRDVKLVVVSTCDSGLGDVSNLTGASYGVQHAFKKAGASKVLTCLWRIDDKATSLFMKSFYNHLVSNGDYHTAIKNAQDEMRASGYNDPYYWAPFVLIE